MTCDTHAVQTYQSITVDVDSLSDGGRNGSNKVRVYDIQTT